MPLYLKIFGEALLVSLALTPVMRRIAFRFGLCDVPNERRMNERPIPNTGGLAIFVSVVIVLVVNSPQRELLPIALGALIIVVTGLIDDRFELHPGAKLGGQLAAAFVVALGGTEVQFLTNPFGGMVYLGAFGVPLTVLWIVSLINAVNFVDGLDGLAAGVVVIACVPLFLVAQRMSPALASLLIAATAGGALGFLRYNFNPASIFLGDTGAMFLGYMIAVASIVGALKGPTVIALGIPTVALGIPILDTAFAIARRVQRRTPVYEADMGHIHHRLLAMGFSAKSAVCILYLITAVMSANAMLLSQMSELEAVAGVLCLTVLGALLVRLLLTGPRGGSHPRSLSQ